MNRQEEQRHWRDHLPAGWTALLSERESLVFEYKIWNLSIAEAWAWRGQILKKHGLPLPDPACFAPEGEEHPIFQPWWLTEVTTQNRAGEITRHEYYRRGKRLKPDSGYIAEYNDQINKREAS
jgi:hypothetical protein